MKIEKQTLGDGAARYCITAARHPGIMVSAIVGPATDTTLVVTDENEISIDIVVLQGDQIAMIRQALQFIDGEAHKHRTAHPAHPAPSPSDGPGTFPTTATPTRSGENADGSSR